MTNKERWNGWLLVGVNGRTYLGKDMNDEVSEDPRQRNLCPCVEIIEEYPIVPGEGRQPTIVPIKSFATLGMFGTDKVEKIVWTDDIIIMGNQEEEALQPYTDAYDKMLEHVERMNKASRARSAITLPSAEDIARLGKGGPGGQPQ